jgi:hypothetical protein
MIDIDRLRTCMGWVIPGSGSEACVQHLLDLVRELGESTAAEYELFIPGLSERDLADLGHPFAAEFIEHVRDVYYGYADTGAWQEIGFVVRG